MHVDDPTTDPVVMALATPDGTCQLLVPRERYDPFEVLAVLGEWEREPEPLYWRVSITEPDGRVVELDMPSGQTWPRQRRMRRGTTGKGAPWARVRDIINQFCRWIAAG